MKYKLFLVLLLTLFSGQSIADLSGIWQDTEGNYFSLQRNNEGNVVFIDLSRSLPRATALKSLGIEDKIEFLSYFGSVSQQAFDGGDFILPILIPLKEVYPNNFVDDPLFFYTNSIIGQPVQFYITNVCPVCGSGISPPINAFGKTIIKVF